MPPSEIRKEAREALRGKWGKAVCIILAYMLFVFALGMVEGLFIETNFIFLLIEIAILVISMPLSFGLIISFMKLKRGEDVKAFGFIKDGFARFGKSWGIWFHTFIRLLLPIICLVLIAILMSVLISVNIVSENAGLSIGFTVLTIALYIATLIYAISRAFLYVLAYNIGYDNPELSSKACVLKSEALMKGNRGSYFLLELYFACLVIAVYIAVVIFTLLMSSSIIGALLSTIFMLIIVLGCVFYITPYMQVATVCFYDRLAKPEAKIIEEEVKIEE